MGLPSGVQWASCNVGAEKPSDLGLYFSWGNTEGHTEDDEYDFSPEVYDQTPGAEITGNLTLSQDAARAYLGAPWRMPTGAEFSELIANCSSVWTTVNGIRGRLFTSNINGNALFFPAAGRRVGTALQYRGQGGDYWSATYASTSNATNMHFSSSALSVGSSYARRYGFSVRAVLMPT